MSDIAIYAPYFLVLLVLTALPLLAQWRWGLPASLGATAAEIGLVILIAYNLVDQQPLPAPRSPMPEQGRDPFTGGRPGQFAEGLVDVLAILFLVIVPGIAALIGGVLSLAWSAVRATRRSAASRLRTPP